MGETVTIERTFPVPPARLWAAWTRPELFAVWFGTDAVEVPLDRVVLEAHVGGRLRATMLLPDGSVKDWEGTFVAVHEPTRLEFTLTDEPGTDPGAPIVVDIAEDGGASSRLTLRQSSAGFDDEGIAAVTAGYGAFFDVMERVLVAVEAPKPGKAGVVDGGGAPR